MNDLNNDLRIGNRAPDFALKGVQDGGEIKEYRLSEHRGRWAVVFFYPQDFSFVCPTEVKEFSARWDEFGKLDAAVMGISTDSVETHAKWVENLGNIRYPLLSDADHLVSKRYQTFLPDSGVSLRGTFIVDPNGVLRYALYHDNAIGRSVTETLRVLAALRTGEMCPAEWQPGDPTLGVHGDFE
jgi:peroxiredoxin 2/4